MKWILAGLGLLVLSAALGWLRFSHEASTVSIAAAMPSQDVPLTVPGAVSQVTQPEVQMNLVTDFDNEPAEAERWRKVNDNVMGGVSQGQMSLTEQGTGLFAGSLSLENNGGFSSVRRTSDDYNFSGSMGIGVRVKGDGRRYQLRLKMTGRGDLSYRAEFETTPGEWQTVEVPFDAFEPVFRGRVLTDAPPLTPTAIEQVGFLISDGKAGAFKLEADWIKAF